MARYTTAVKYPRIMQKFYIYDPNVADELGGLRVYSDKDDKGVEKEGTRHILAVTQQVQYWIDQGLLGEKPVGQIGDKAKKFLAQVTRGRSEDNETDPKRIPKYDRRTQSGSPSLAGQPGRRAAKKKGKKSVGSKVKAGQLPGSTNELPGSNTSTTGKPTTRVVT